MSLKKASRTKSLSLSDDFPLRVSPQRNATTSVGAGSASGVGGPSGSGLAGGAIGGLGVCGGPRTGSLASRRIEDSSKIFKYIDDNVIGKGVAFLGPYGRRKGEFRGIAKLCLVGYILPFEVLYVNVL